MVPASRPTEEVGPKQSPDRQTQRLLADWLAVPFCRDPLRPDGLQTRVSPFRQAARLSTWATLL